MKTTFKLIPILLLFIACGSAIEVDSEISNTETTSESETETETSTETEIEDHKSDLYPIVGDYVEFISDNQLSGRVISISEDKTFKFGRVEFLTRDKLVRIIKFYRKGTWEGNTFSFEGGNTYESFYDENTFSDKAEFQFLSLPGYTGGKIDYYRVSNIKDPKFNNAIEDKSDLVITDSFLLRDWTSSSDKSSFILTNKYIYTNGFSPSLYTRNKFVIKVPDIVGINNGFINSIEYEIFFWGKDYFDRDFFSGTKTSRSIKIDNPNVKTESNYGITKIFYN